MLHNALGATGTDDVTYRQLARNTCLLYNKALKKTNSYISDTSDLIILDCEHKALEHTKNSIDRDVTV